MEALRPILLLGMPRSGTTWVGKVFDSHPDVLYRHEPDNGGALAPLPLVADIRDTDRYRGLVQDFVERLSGQQPLSVTGKLPLFPKSYYSPLRFHSRRLILVAGKAAARAFGDITIPELVPSGTADSGIRLVWKSIESLGRIGVLASALPYASVVHIVRHPCGYVASVLRGEAKGALPGAVPSSDDYGVFEALLATGPARRRGLTLDHLQSLTPVERLTWRWLLFNEKAMEELAEVGNATRVRYEDLCELPAESYRTLLDFAGLSWTGQTERFIAESTATGHTAYFSVYKDPAQSASAWQRTLGDEEIGRIADVVAGSGPGGLYGY